MEHLYHKCARQAFDFCKKYQRRAEFRKLCDNLRTHLSQLQKAQHLSYSVKLNNPETIAMMQETRLYQFDISIQMELWQVCVCTAHCSFWTLSLKNKNRFCF